MKLENKLQKIECKFYYKKGIYCGYLDIDIEKREDLEKIRCGYIGQYGICNFKTPIVYIENKKTEWKHNKINAHLNQFNI